MHKLSYLIKYDIANRPVQLPKGLLHLATVHSLKFAIIHLSIKKIIFLQEPLSSAAFRFTKEKKQVSKVKEYNSDYNSDKLRVSMPKGLSRHTTNVHVKNPAVKCQVC